MPKSTKKQKEPLNSKLKKIKIPTLKLHSKFSMEIIISSNNGKVWTKPTWDFDDDDDDGSLCIIELSEKE